jgi:hypothetical protein
MRFLVPSRDIENCKVIRRFVGNPADWKITGKWSPAISLAASHEGTSGTTGAIMVFDIRPNAPEGPLDAVVGRILGKGREQWLITFGI